MKKAILTLSPFTMMSFESSLRQAKPTFSFFLSFVFLLFSSISFGQASLQVTVLDGDATTTCNGLFGFPPVVQWSVDVEGQGEEIYPLFANCFNSVPMVQYNRTEDCHWQMPPTIEVCFKAFENEALFCNVNEDCSVTVCGDFAVPLSSTTPFDYTLELADNLDSDGFVNFRVELIGDYLGSPNDAPCTAYDLGVLNANTILGTTNLSQFNNACANQGGTAAELSPSGSIFDNQGLWFQFETGNDPIDMIGAEAVSDPENLGDPVNLQLEIYKLQNGNCAVLQHVKTQNNESENDISMFINCLETNSTYLILVDGTFGSSAGIEGYFDLQIRTESVSQAANFICDAENLGVIPEGGSVQALSQTNNCANAISDPSPINFNLNQSVWFQFTAPPSGSVVISADNHTPMIGDELLDIQLALFETSDNTCSGTVTEIASGYSAAALNEILEVECLEAGQMYWVLLDGAQTIEAATFDISISDANNYPPQVDANVTICSDASYTIGTNTYTQNGIYTDTLTAVNGCDSIVHTTLAIASPLVANLSEVNSAMLETSLDGVATADPSGGSPTYSYLWSNGATSQTISNVLSGNYCVTITDALGCTVEDCVEIYYIGAVVASINNDALDCHGDSNGFLALTSSGGTPPYTFVWENQDNAATGNGNITAENEIANIQNLTAGEYSVTVTGSLGQTATLLTEITQPDMVVTVLNPTLCFGESLTIGNTDYSTAGSYNEMLQTTIGCDSLVTGMISILPQNTALNPVQICANESYLIGNSEYNTTGDFEDILTDSNGCDSIVTTQLTVLDPINLSIQIDQLATGYQLSDATASLDITGGTGSYTITWDTGDNQNNISNLEGGSTICVEVIDDLNCMAQVCEFVSYTNENLAHLMSEDALCSDTNTGSITLEAGAGLAPFVYLWEETNSGINGSGILSQDEMFIVQNLTTGIYSVTVTDDNGVSANMMTEIEAPAPIEITILELQTPTCVGDCDAQFSLELQGGTGVYTYTWSDANLTALSGNGLCADEYSLTVTDENGCESSQIITIVEPEILSATATAVASVSCFEGNNGQAMVSSNMTTQTILWDNGETTATATQLNAGLHQVSITNTNGCMATTSVEIVQPSAPVGVTLLEQESISCNGEADGSLLAIATGPGTDFSYTWTTSTGNSINNSADLITELPAGDYTVVTSNELGCTALESYTLEQPEALYFEVSSTDATCLNDGNSGSISFQSVEGGTSPYLFSIDGDSYLTEPEFSNLAAGNYAVYLQDIEGCQINTDISVQAPPSLEVSVPTDLFITLGESLQLNPFVNSDNATYIWSSSDPLFDCFDCESVQVQPTINTIYNLEVVDSLTFCSNSIEFLVDVDVIRDLYIPNAFSPNDDGINDYFLPKGGIGIAQIQTMSVFDRTGNLVFQQQNIPAQDETKGWDGNFRGKDLPEGVYVYTMLVEYLDGEVLHYAGDVAIIY